MTFYEVFGGVLQSEIEFPELKTSHGVPPDWTLRRDARLTPLANAAVVGEEELVGGVAARLERDNDRFRLRFDDTGTFDVARRGQSIRWLPSPNAIPAVVRADVLGRVLSLALHAAGDLCLHASAAAIGGKAVAFVGSRGYGKSTLTMALVAAGARLVADDTLRLTGRPIRVAVAVPALRLREDAAARFGVDSAPAAIGDKVIVQSAALPDEQWLPLEAIYVLAPRIPSGGNATVQRHRLPALEATLALVGHGKIAALLGGAEAAAVLQRASVVATQVAVYALVVPRDLALLDHVASRIRAWHGEDAAAASS